MNKEIETLITLKYGAIGISTVRQLPFSIVKSVMHSLTDGSHMPPELLRAALRIRLWSPGTKEEAKAAVLKALIEYENGS